MHPNEVKALLTNGTIKSSTDLRPTPQDAIHEANANEKSIMNLLLAAAAKSKNNKPNGVAKAASMSELDSR